MVGIVILNYKTWEKTVSCVKSIINTYEKEKQIVIVDNASPNDSVEKLANKFPKEKYPEIHIVESTINGGFSAGNNIGFYFLRKQYPKIEEIIITNNDIIFLEDTIDQLTFNLKETKDAVVFAPHVLSIDNESTNKPWIIKPSMLQSIGLLSTDKLLLPWESIHGIQRVYMVSGCCFAVNSNAFEQIGAFDENVFLYNEESILSYKAQKHKLGIYVNSNAKIIHDHGSTTGNGNIFVDKEMFKSSVFFFRNYEKKKRGTLFILYVYWVAKMLVKAVLKRYQSADGLVTAFGEMYLVL